MDNRFSAKRISLQLFLKNSERKVVVIEGATFFQVVMPHSHVTVLEKILEMVVKRVKMQFIDLMCYANLSESTKT